MDSVNCALSDYRHRDLLGGSNPIDPLEGTERRDEHLHELEALMVAIQSTRSRVLKVFFYRLMLQILS
jgi:hypothetical protein